MNINKLSVISLTCINSDIDSTSESIIEILNGSSSGNKCEVVKKMAEILNIDDLFPIKYNDKKLKIVLWEPKCKLGTTIFASNAADGSDSLVHILTKKYHYETYKIYITIEKESRYPTFLFSYKKGNIERVVRAAFEDKWIFFQRGIPLPTEDISAYDKRIINQRLNREVIVSILKRKVGISRMIHFGCRIANLLIFILDFRN